MSSVDPTRGALRPAPRRPIRRSQPRHIALVLDDYLLGLAARVFRHSGAQPVGDRTRIAA